MHLELADCETMIENEIEQAATQKDIALSYAMAMCSSWPTDWKRVNAAIAAKWPKGLIRVKEMAWKLVEQKRKEQIERQIASN
jgi:hypothetical protein